VEIRTDGLPLDRCRHEATVAGGLGAPFGPPRRRLLFNARRFVAVVGGGREALRGGIARRGLRAERVQLAVAVLQRLLLPVLPVLLPHRVPEEERPERFVRSQVRAGVEGRAEPVHIRSLGGAGVGAGQGRRETRSRLSATDRRSFRRVEGEHVKDETSVRRIQGIGGGGGQKGEGIEWKETKKINTLEADFRLLKLRIIKIISANMNFCQVYTVLRVT